MRRYLGPILVALILSTGCVNEENDGASEPSVASASLGLTIEPKRDSTLLVGGLSMSTYKDISTSNNHFYALTTTGYKRVAHTNVSALPTAPNTKNILLDRIDYVNATWGLIGARSPSGSNPAQLVIKADMSTARTVNLPSDVTTILDIEARNYSTSRVDVYVKTYHQGYREYIVKKFRYNWTAQSLSLIVEAPVDMFTGPITSRDSSGYIVGSSNDVNNMGIPYLYKLSLSSSPYVPVWENQEIYLDTDDDPALGFVDFINSHGYRVDLTEARILDSDALDWGKYQGGDYQFVALSPAGDSTYDLVILPDVNVTFIKTPAAEYSYWNGSGFVANNNCYNYGCNRSTMNFAQPGYQSNHGLDGDCSPENVIEAAVADGLELLPDPPAGQFPTVPEGKTLVAAIAGMDTYDFFCGSWHIPGDYHWYRRDRDGNWTHKPGPCNATNRKWPYEEGSGIITDPRLKAGWDQSLYSDFVGFFLVDSNYNQGMGLEYINGNSYKVDDGDGCGYYYPTAGTAATASRAEIGEPTGPLNVTIALYSGLPNPRMLVEDDEGIQQLKDAYDEMVAQGGERDGVGSGYMGLIVQNPCGLRGLPESFRLFSHEEGPNTRPGAKASSINVIRAVETAFLDRAEHSDLVSPEKRDSIRDLNGR